jgi:hypothetical protein
MGHITFALPRAKPIVAVTGVMLTQCIALEGVFPSRPQVDCRSNSG